MTSMPLPPIAPSPLAEDRIEVDGTPVTVLASYPTWGGLRLHSLATPTRYRCGACDRVRESALVATGEQILACPACFAYLARARADTVDIPEQRKLPERCAVSSTTRRA